MLYQQVRPKKFEQIRGNKEVVAMLAGFTKKPIAEIPHAYLFQGPSGCGKTTMALILAAELGCNDLDIITLNAANTRGVDTIRRITDSATLQPIFGKTRAYILDESQQLTPAAQQALLKVIEDCPSHTFFMFCTTDPEALIPTIRNRCAKLSVSLLRKPEMIKLLEEVIAEAKLSIDPVVEQTLIAAIVDAAEGCPRSALMLVEQVQNMENPDDVLAFVKDAVVSERDTLELSRELISNRVNRWATCTKMMSNLPTDTEKVRLSVLMYFRKVLISEQNIDQAARFAEMISVFEKPTYSGGQASLARMIFECCVI